MLQNLTQDTKKIENYLMLQEDKDKYYDISNVLNHLSDFEKEVVINQATYDKVLVRLSDKTTDRFKVKLYDEDREDAQNKIDLCL